MSLAAKGGVSDHNAATELAKFVIDECDKLKFSGLMTIGGLCSLSVPLGCSRSVAAAPGSVGAEVQVIKECREYLCSELMIEPSEVELSMGMSNDFEEAVRTRVAPLVYT